MATIFTGALTSSGFGGGDYTFRTTLPLTGGAQDQVRVTFQADSGGCTIATAGIGISTTPVANDAAAADTTATPVQLLFSGNPGFTLGANATIISDWVNLTGFTASDFLVCIFDFTSGAGRYEVFTQATRYKSPGPSYNSTDGQTGYSGANNIRINVTTIETQAAAVAGEPARGLCLSNFAYRSAMVAT